jgi:hypothetical protein
MKDAIIYDTDQTIQVKVQYFKCQNVGCAGCLPYNGDKHYIFNFSSSTLFTYRLLNSFDAAFERSTFDHFIKVYIPRVFATYQTKDAPNLTMCSKTTFISAWFSWTKLKTFNYDQAFTCNICSNKDPSETIWILDGTSHGIKKQHLIGSTKWHEACAGIGDRVTGCSIIEYALFMRPIRLLLLKYSKSSMCNQLMTNDEATQLRAVAEQKLPYLHSMFQFIDSLSSQYYIYPPEGFRLLLKNIARRSPIIALINRPGLVLPILQTYVNGTVQCTATDIRLLMSNTPIVLRWLKVPGVRVGRPRQLHSLLRPLLQEIIRKCQLILDYPIISKPSIEWSSMDDWSVGHFFSPLFNVQNGLPIFDADRNKKKTAMALERERDEKKRRTTTKPFNQPKLKAYGPSEEEMCQRQRTSHRNLTPGLITMFCEHSICHGMMLLHEHESVAHIFNIFFMRMKTAPKMIIYDRACQLAVYALRRAPKYFSNTIFRVDAVHWANHVDCSDGYNVKMFRQLDMISDNAPFTNTQICEQSNAVLKHIRNQCAFMTQTHFLIYTRLLFYYFNLNKKSKNMLL